MTTRDSHTIPKTETPEAGRLRCAQDLAAAEEFAAELEWVFSWDADEDGCIGCDCGSEDCACSMGTWHDVMSCVLRNQAGDVLASLGSICDPSADYARVIEAELASEAMVNYLECAKMMAS